jgi:hypothetical protein
VPSALDEPLLAAALCDSFFPACGRGGELVCAVGGRVRAFSPHRRMTLFPVGLPRRRVEAAAAANLSPLEA